MCLLRLLKRKEIITLIVINICALGNCLHYVELLKCSANKNIDICIVTKH